VTSRDAADRVERFAAERWFLDRGVPAVLRPGALLRRLWPRSAPALAAFAVMMTCSVIIVVVSGKHTINIDGTPTRTEWFLLAVVLLVLPLAATVGWLVSRIRTGHGRLVAAAVSAIIAVLGGIFGGPSPRIVPDLLLVIAIIAVILVLTTTGVGSVLAWAVRMTLAHLALTATLFVRALPVVLLTVLVFFNSYVWLMAAIVSRARLWLALMFLFLIAAAFLTSSMLERVRPILATRQVSPEEAVRLVGTPFETMPDRPTHIALSRVERGNVAFVLTVSQIVQILLVSAVTSAIFFVLGLILLSPRLLAEWTRNGSSDGQILGMTFPVPQSLIQIALFLGAMTFMYISARAVADEDHRTRFLDPLVDDLRLTLVARDRYRTATARGPDAHG
jgi:hypothetical protein